MIIHWPKNYPAPPQYQPGAVNDQVISLLDVTATTLWMAGVARPPLMQSRLFLGDQADRPRTYAFSARDRIDETVMRKRSVRDARYRYIRNFTPGAGFASLNRYKEKCFLVQPLMRQLLAEGKLTGPAAELMKPFPAEMLYDTQADPYEIENLAESDRPNTRWPWCDCGRRSTRGSSRRATGASGLSRRRSWRRSRRRCTTGSAPLRGMRRSERE